MFCAFLVNLGLFTLKSRCTKSPKSHAKECQLLGFQTKLDMIWALQSLLTIFDNSSKRFSDGHSRASKDELGNSSRQK